ncbi:hypothetical protein B0H16DRAFT_1518531 [Mycena metata]|uniref:Uncharacterized protein n=1 Tax=Mycena metata TaxID=1033252 RepID=A0AAD7JR21_9AGAR|nr:hypothetical protein B0H16DRAFT_1518531 [Mycena metata]
MARDSLPTLEAISLPTRRRCVVPSLSCLTPPSSPASPRNLRPQAPTRKYCVRPTPLAPAYIFAHSHFVHYLALVLRGALGRNIKGKRCVPRCFAARLRVHRRGPRRPPPRPHVHHRPHPRRPVKLRPRIRRCAPRCTRTLESSTRLRTQRPKRTRAHTRTPPPRLRPAESCRSSYTPPRRRTRPRHRLGACRYGLGFTWTCVCVYIKSPRAPTPSLPRAHVRCLYR